MSAIVRMLLATTSLCLACEPAVFDNGLTFGTKGCWASHRLSLGADSERFLAEIERLRADLVWAVRHGASEGYDGNSDPCIWYSGIERHRDVLCSRELSVDIDGTPESICRAVREARDGVR